MCFRVSNQFTVAYRVICLLTVLIGQLCTTSSQAEESVISSENHSQIEDEASQTEILWEWDPYYSDVAANISLTSKPIPTITSDNEGIIYSELIKDSLVPRFMLLEASVYPLPLLGTHLKKHSPDLYKQGRIGNSSLNIFDSVTAGFQEPWAVSAFFGNIAKLVRPGETRVGNNMGYTGYLVSAGAKHIKSNVLIDDVWHELEWKIKGKRDYADEKMSWSFRAGGKFHRNPEVTDVFYVGIFRSNLDHRAALLQLLKNSTFDWKIQFAQRSGRFVRQDLVLGKKFPMENREYTPTLDIGLVWESPEEYSGTLRNRSNSTLTLLLRPSIEF